MYFSRKLRVLAAIGIYSLTSISCLISTELAKARKPASIGGEEQESGSATVIGSDGLPVRPVTAQSPQIPITITGITRPGAGPTPIPKSGGIGTQPIPTPRPVATSRPIAEATPSPDGGGVVGGSWDGTKIPIQLSGGLTGKQVDAILSLVSIAENSSTNWWSNYNYIEDIKDGRGYTINIVGFCTGCGDFLYLVQQLPSGHPLTAFLPTLTQIMTGPLDSNTGCVANGPHGTLDSQSPSLTSVLKNMTGTAQAQYITATWLAISHYYWDPATAAAAKLGLVRAISIGQFYDVSLNAGADALPKLIAKVKAKPPIRGGDEAAWLKEFQGYWRAMVMNPALELDTGDDGKPQPDRVDMWASILASGNLDLDRPINNLTCYGESFSIN